MRLCFLLFSSLFDIICLSVRQTAKGESPLDKRKIIYYKNEQNDEFSLAKIEPKRIDASYVYGSRTLWKRFTHFFWYRIVAMPIAFIYTKLEFHHRIVNAEVMKPYRKSGYFM